MKVEKESNWNLTNNVAFPREAGGLYSDWSTAYEGGSNASKLDHLVASESKIAHIVTTLFPSPAHTDTFSKNPVTELCCLNFDDLAQAQAEDSAVNAALISFRAALLEKLPEGKRPKSWSMGYVNRPGFREHPKAPSGRATVALLAVGWESKDVHMEAKSTQVFADGIAPVRERMLPPLTSADMRHVSFTKL